MFITFNTKAQALNYIKRNKDLQYHHDEGCGCCYFFGYVELDGNKLVLHEGGSDKGYISDSATVIGKVRSR